MKIKQYNKAYTTTTTCTGICAGCRRAQESKPALLPSAAGLKKSALTNRPQRHTSDQNYDKYIDRQSSGVTTGQRIMNEL